MGIQLGKYERKYQKDVEDFLNKLGVEYSIRQYERTDEELEKIRKQHKEKYYSNIEKSREKQRNFRIERKKNNPPPNARQLAKYNELVGQKFGELTVIEFLERTYMYTFYYKCQCSCGNIIRVEKFNLIRGKKTSCGCQKKKGGKNL